MSHATALTRAVTILAMALCAAAPALAFKRTSKGEPLQDFELTQIAGSPLRLMESLGERATVVIFWASWSPRSAEALEELQRVYAEHRDAGLSVLAVNVDHQQLDATQREEVSRFVADRQLTYPVVIDGGLAVFDRYGVIAVPSLVLADSQGTIVGLLEGYSNMTRGGFKEQVLETLGVLHTRQEITAEDDGQYHPAGKAARYYQMGELFRAKKMARRATDAFRKAVSEDPNYVAAYLRLAEVLAQRGKTDEAARAREQAAAVVAAEGPSDSAADRPAGVDNPGTPRVESQTETAPPKAGGVPPRSLPGTGPSPQGGPQSKAVPTAGEGRP